MVGGEGRVGSMAQLYSGSVLRVDVRGRPGGSVLNLIIVVVVGENDIGVTVDGVSSVKHRWGQRSGFPLSEDVLQNLVQDIT